MQSHASALSLALVLGLLLGLLIGGSRWPLAVMAQRALTGDAVPTLGSNMASVGHVPASAHLTLWDEDEGNTLPLIYNLHD